MVGEEIGTLDPQCPDALRHATITNILPNHMCGLEDQLVHLKKECPPFEWNFGSPEFSMAFFIKGMPLRFMGEIKQCHTKKNIIVY